MIAEMFSRSVIVGAGEIGVQTLRFLKAVSGNVQPEEDQLGLDPSLGEAISSGHIHLLGIDLDNTAPSTFLPVETNLLKLQGYLGKNTINLPNLRKEWLHLDGSGISRVLDRLSDHDSRNLVSCEGGCSPFPSITNWLTSSLFEDPGRLGLDGQSEAYNYWRPLGRLALFLNLDRIREKLMEACQTYGGHPQQAIIICSLGDGTGSGMFWDLAVLLRLMLPTLQITGMFVTDTAVSHRGTHSPINTYAALKEMVNLNHRPEKWPLEYPSGLGYLANRGLPASPIFNEVFLFESQPVSKERFSTPRLDMASFQIAQSIQALLRQEIREVLQRYARRPADLGNNCLDHCRGLLGTTSAYFFQPVEAAEVVRMADHYVLENLKDEIARQQERLSWSHLSESSGLTELINSAASMETSQCRKIANTRENDPFEGTREAIKSSLERLESEGADAKKIYKEMFIKSLSQLRNVMLDESDYLRLEVADNRIYEDFEEAIKQRMTPIAAKIREARTRQFFDEHFEEELEKTMSDLTSRKPESEDQKNVYMKIQTPQMLFSMKDFYEDPKGMARLGISLANTLLRSNLHAALQRKILELFLEDLEASIENASGELIGLADFFRRTWIGLAQDIKDAAHSLKEHVIQSRLDEAERLARQKLVNTRLNREIKRQGGARLDKRTEETLKSALRKHIERNGGTKHWYEGQRDYFLKHLPEEYRDKILSDLVEKAFRRFGSQIESESEIEKEEELSNFGDLAGDFLETCLGQCDAANPDKLDELLDLINGTANTFQACMNRMLAEVSGLPQDRYDIEKMDLKFPAVFSDSHEQNSIRRKWAYLAPFGKNMAQAFEEDKKKDLLELLKTYVNNELGADRVHHESRSVNAVLFFANLYRNPQELEDIATLKRSYDEKRVGGNAAEYHVDARFADLPGLPVWQEHTDKALCGNPGCDYNIGDLPRAALICPQCSSPIWNRCGNADCTENKLTDRIDWKTDKKHIPTRCPDCGKGLRTYWWHCEKHPVHQRVPMDKTSCPKCLHEVQQGHRHGDDVGKRPASLGQECPGCLKVHKNPSERFLIHEDLARYMSQGINGHDLLPFRQLAQRLKIQVGPGDLAYRCPNGHDHDEHALIPVYHDHDDDPWPHLVFRLHNGQFVCPDFPKLKFWTCSHCDYPIESGLTETDCPRCLNHLKACQYCSKNRERYYAHDGPRCGHCTNVMQPTKDRVTPLAEPAFCPNIFACPAAIHPRETSAAHRLGHCHACPGPHAPLIKKSRLEKLIDDCPLCLQLLKQGSKEDALKLTELPEQRKSHRCRICGSQPQAVLEWMTLPKTESSDHLPRVPFEAGLAVLRALQQHHQVTDAYTALDHSPDGSALVEVAPYTLSSLLRLFASEGRTYSVLEQRLAALSTSLESERTVSDPWAD